MFAFEHNWKPNIRACIYFREIWFSPFGIREGIHNNYCELKEYNINALGIVTATDRNKVTLIYFIIAVNLKRQFYQSFKNVFQMSLWSLITDALLRTRIHEFPATLSDSFFRVTFMSGNENHKLNNLFISYFHSINFLHRRSSYLRSKQKNSVPRVSALHVYKNLL